MKVPRTAPTASSLLQTLAERGTDLPRLLESGIGHIPADRYLHWDEIRHRCAPEGFSTEEWWLAIKLARAGMRQALGFLDGDGHPFTFALPPFLQAHLHRVDRDASHGRLAEHPILNSGQRDRYVVNSLIEEAIRSSQLEGAATTRRVAREMLRTGRKPRDTSERMIVNNYRAMEFVREIRDETITPEHLLELQRIVTHATLEDATAAGRWRRPGERVEVVAAGDSAVLHTPPAARTLGERIERLCGFANEGEDAEPFLHPVIRAVLLHFVLAYDHPFVDGNGRTARALFYWYVARAGYPLLEFISISGILHGAPARYARAFLFTETDESDVTYFIDHQLAVIVRAVDELLGYLRGKVEEVNEVERILRAEILGQELNHRQVALLSHAIRHPDQGYTIRSHGHSHRVSYHTARTDLLTLLQRGLLVQRKRGRELVFRPVTDLRQRLQGLP